MRLLLLLILVSSCAVARPRPEPDRPGQPVPTAVPQRPQPTPVAIAMLPLAHLGEETLSQWLQARLKAKLQAHAPGGVVSLPGGQVGYLKGPLQTVPLVVGGRISGLRRMAGEARLSLELRLQRSRDAAVLWSKTITVRAKGEGEEAVHQAADVALASLLESLLPLRSEWLQDASD